MCCISSLCRPYDVSMTERQQAAERAFAEESVKKMQKIAAEIISQHRNSNRNSSSDSPSETESFDLADGYFANLKSRIENFQISGPDIDNVIKNDFNKRQVIDSGVLLAAGITGIVLLALGVLVHPFSAIFLIVLGLTFIGSGLNVFSACKPKDPRIEEHKQKEVSFKKEIIKHIVNKSELDIRQELEKKLNSENIHWRSLAYFYQASPVESVT